MLYPADRPHDPQHLALLFDKDDLDQLISKGDLAELFSSGELSIERIRRNTFDVSESQGNEEEPEEQASAKSEQAASTEKVNAAPRAEDDLSALPLGRGDSIDAVGLYLKEMSRVPLLTNTEEVDLAQRIERGKRAEKQLKKLNGRTPAKKKTEFAEYIVDGKAARDHLIAANTRLVVSIAKRYIGRGVPFLDLIQEGNLGLMKAVNKYDYRRGFRFSTYATWWIRQTITRSIADQGRTIRVPVHMIDRIRNLYKTARRLEQKLGRPPKVEELAEALDTDVRKVQWMLRVSWLPLSLESPVGDEEDSELGMFVEDKSTPSPGQSAYQNMLCNKVEEILETLSPREARILRLRFGLENGRMYTLEEVGEKFGLTRERIRQIEGKALRRLRHPMRARQLQEYL